MKPSSLVYFRRSVVAHVFLRKSKVDRQTTRKPPQKVLLPREIISPAKIILLRMRNSLLMRGRVGASFKWWFGDVCIHWLMSGIPVTEDSQTSLVAKRTMEEDHPQCCCAMSKSPLTQATFLLVGQDRAVTYTIHIPIRDLYMAGYCQLCSTSHTAIAELVAVAGLFLNASGPPSHCFLNPYSSYAELLTTHSPWRLLTYTSAIHTTLSCCTVLSLPVKPSWMVCVMYSSILNSSEPNKVADTATQTAQVRVNVAHTSTSFTSSWEDNRSTTTDTSFPHGFWDSTLVRISHHCILLQQQDFKDIHKLATSERAVQDFHVYSIWTVLECMCEQVMGERDFG